MGRHSRFLYIGERKSLKKLRKEILGNNKIIKEEQKQEATKHECKSDLNEKIKSEEKVLYNPIKPPKEVISMYGTLEIKPSVLQEYINEFYANK